jgi:hypothetical protein
MKKKPALKKITKKPTPTKKAVAKSTYVSSIPKTMRKGYAYLCHNHIQHDINTPPNTNGFRAWWTNELPEGFVRCKCGWSGVPHYLLKR